ATLADATGEGGELLWIERGVDVIAPVLAPRGTVGSAERVALGLGGEAVAAATVVADLVAVVADFVFVHIAVAADVEAAERSAFAHAVTVGGAVVALLAGPEVPIAADVDLAARGAIGACCAVGLAVIAFLASADVPVAADAVLARRRAGAADDAGLAAE